MTKPWSHSFVACHATHIECSSFAGHRAGRLGAAVTGTRTRTPDREHQQGSHAHAPSPSVLETLLYSAAPVAVVFPSTSSMSHGVTKPTLFTGYRPTMVMNEWRVIDPGLFAHLHV